MSFATRRASTRSARADRVAAGAFHLSHHVAHDVIAHREAFVDLRGERRAAVHGRDERALARVHGRLADELEPMFATCASPRNTGVSWSVKAMARGRKAASLAPAPTAAG